jgi:hypothetical protein
MATPSLKDQESYGRATQGETRPRRRSKRPTVVGGMRSWGWVPASITQRFPSFDIILVTMTERAVSTPLCAVHPCSLAHWIYWARVGWPPKGKAGNVSGGEGPIQMHGPIFHHLLDWRQCSRTTPALPHILEAVGCRFDPGKRFASAFNAFVELRLDCYRQSIVKRIEVVGLRANIVLKALRNPKVVIFEDAQVIRPIDAFPLERVNLIWGLFAPHNTPVRATFQRR